MAIEWIYADGGQWVTFDKIAQSNIECLWSNNSSSWITCQSFQVAVYVDIAQMTLICNGRSHSIVRLTS